MGTTPEKATTAGGGKSKSQWHTSVVLTIENLRQEDREFKVNLGYIRKATVLFQWIVITVSKHSISFPFLCKHWNLNLFYYSSFETVSLYSPH